MSRGYLSKGFTDIGEYFSQLEDKPEIIFITGFIEDEHKARLEADCKKAGLKLTFKFLINDKEKFKILAESKALFFPSRWEGFGIPPAEAFFVQTPVICYDLPVLEEIYKEYPHYMKMGNKKKNIKLINKIFTSDKRLFRNVNEAKEYVTSFGCLESFSQNINHKVSVLAQTKTEVEQPKSNIVSNNQPKKKASEFSKPDRKPKFKSGLKISVILPFYNGNMQYFGECVQSIERQTHKNYEIIIIDDGCTEQRAKQAIEIIKKNGEWKVITHDRNKGIAQSITDGVEKANGDIIAFLDADDTLRDRALENIALVFTQEPKLDIAYTNEVQINDKGEIIFEEKKPDWSVECLYTGQYLNHLTAYRAKFLKKLMPCNKQYGGSWDYDLLLRAAETKPHVRHIPKPLYNWRIHQQQVGGFGRAYSAQANAMEALNDHLARTGKDEKKQIVQTPILGYFDSKHNCISNPQPKILVITMTRNVHLLGQLLISMDRNKDLEYNHLIVHHEPQGKWDKDLLEFFRQRDLMYELVKGQFNFPQTHNYMFEKYGKDYDYFVIVNDDIIMNKRWLPELISMFDYDKTWGKVGVVGCKLMFPNHEDIRHIRLPEHWYENTAKIQHAGVCLLRDRGAAHCYVNRPCNMRAVNYIRPFETVTFAIVAIASDCYAEVKMDPKYDSDLNDMDFCIRARMKQLNIIYTPWANAIHMSSVTRKKYKCAGKVVNHTAFKKQYRELIKGKMNYRKMLDREEDGL